VEIGKGSASGGGISDTSGDSTQVSLISDLSGNPIVAWSEDLSGIREIYMKRWDGNNWVEVGPNSASGSGLSSTGGDSAVVDVALIAPTSPYYEGNPIVTWQENHQNAPVKMYNGDSWMDVGSPLGVAGIVYGPSIGINWGGDPIVAFEAHLSGYYQIFVRRWNGSSWVDMSGSPNGISNNTATSGWPEIAMDGVGNPIVVWNDNESGDREIFIKRWNGSSWEEMGVNSASAGGISDNAGDSRRPVITTDSNGYPIIAWADDTSGDYEIYVKRWNGSGWEDVGSDSSSGGGISNNEGVSRSPSISIDRNDNPIVAWHDDSSGNNEIYVLRWDGEEWVELTSNSATGGGISNSSGDSLQPSIAVDQDGSPVIAWSDNSSGNFEIFVKRYKRR